jgi:hypothetical protein
MDEALDKLSAGDDDGALSVIERSLQEKQTGQGLIAKALILERLERFSEAASAAELATQASLPSPLRSQARAIAERNRNLEEGRLAGWVGFSMDLGYDSNLLAPVTQAQNNMTSGAFFDAKAGVGVPLFQWASFNGTLAYQLQVQDAIGPSRNALVLTHYIEPSFAWESSSVQILAAPYASTFYLGTENFDYIVGGLGRLKLTTPGGSGWLGEAAMERVSATQDDYPTLNGWNYRVKFQWNRTLGAWTPSVRAGFERNNSYLYRPSITLSEAYMAYQLGFDLRWDFSSHFAITGRHLYALKDFLSAPSSSTTGTGHDLEGSWKLSYAPTATFEVGAIYEASYLTLLGSRYFSWAAFTTLAWKLNYYLGGI